MWGFVAHDKDVNEFSPPLRPLMAAFCRSFSHNLPAFFPQLAAKPIIGPSPYNIIY
jgi:hypothetical protein